MKNFDITKELEQARKELQEAQQTLKQTELNANQAVQQAYDQMVAKAGVVEFLESKVKKEETEA